jgi:hypothetical protein
VELVPSGVNLIWCGFGVDLVWIWCGFGAIWCELGAIWCEFGTTRCEFGVIRVPTVVNLIDQTRPKTHTFSYTWLM